MEEAFIVQQLMEEQGLCPHCEKSIQKRGDLLKIDNEEGQIYYLLCYRCSKKMSRSNATKQQKMEKRIEDNLNHRFSLFAAQFFEPDHFQNILDDKKHQGPTLKELPVNNPWNEDDRQFFEKNQGVRFRAREIYPDELREIHNGSMEGYNEALQKNIKYAIIHQVAPGQRVRSYVGGLDDKPYHEEAYVAALFLVMLSPELGEQDIDRLYQEIKERKKTVAELGLDIEQLYNQNRTT